MKQYDAEELSIKQIIPLLNRCVYSALLLIVNQVLIYPHSHEQSTEACPWKVIERAIQNKMFSPPLNVPTVAKGDKTLRF